MAANYKIGLFWAVWSVITITLGSGIGALVGSTKTTTGTTMAVVTGMGCVIGIGALVKAIVHRVDKGQTQGWQALTVKASFLLGAVNLAVGMVLAPIAICSIVWPFAAIAWAPVGMVIGAIAAIVGGILAAKIEVQALANPIVVD
ncbi:MAG: hypothetical protein HC851_16690 [Acaryochloris sp. RU_4_1]|nr:hypothetical protein [Acaryochloris sp. RU_4_1]NJR54707.1 hypothetical protein [Acaryochloris sp. CRU_2_0]